MEFTASALREHGDALLRSVESLNADRVTARMAEALATVDISASIVFPKASELEPTLLTPILTLILTLRPSWGRERELS